MRRTLAQIAGITAPQRYRNGGHVRGPGTGTSDSINAKLSDGEFVLPNDTVRKVGVKSLRDLVHETHTPVKGEGKPGHFVGGGLASSEEFEQQMAKQRLASRQRTDAAARAAEDEAQAAVPVPSAASQIPTGGLTAPSADGSQDRWSNTETGRNLSNIASALPGSLGGAVPAIARTGGAISGGIDAATRLLNAGAGAAAISAIPGAASAQSLAPASPAGAGRGMVNPASVNPALPPPASPPRTLAGIAGLTGSTNDVTRVGNSYSGSNVSGDITVNGRTPGGGFMNTGNSSAGSAATPSPVGMTTDQAQRQGLVGERVGYNPAYDQRLTGTQGTPNPQNMAAADNLAATQKQGARERLMALASGPGSGPVETGSFTGGYSGNVGSTSTYGNMLGRSQEQRLRDAEVSASSITNSTRWGGRNAGNSASMQGFRAALQRESNGLQNQAGQDLEALRQSGALSREGMQQAGETQRTGIRAEGVNAANQISSGRLKLEQIAAGYSNRSADRIDRAQAELEGAKTPEAQKSARERLMALAGKAPQNEWGVQVTPTTKNLDGSSTQGSVYRYNKATGETARVDEGQPASLRVASQAQFDALPKGATYTGSDGRTYRKPV